MIDQHYNEATSPGINNFEQAMANVYKVCTHEYHGTYIHINIAYLVNSSTVPWQLNLSIIFSQHWQ